MPSTYSSLKIQLMATGENNTTWGDVTNLNLGTALEEAIVGSADVTFASGNVTLTLTDTNASQTARNMRLRCTGTTGGSTRNLVVPAIEKPYIVQNDCADSVVVKTVTGTGITVPAGTTMWVYSDGTNVVDAVTHLSSLTLNTALSAAQGGTGQSSYTDGQLLIGNSSGNTLTKATLTAGSGVSITNGGGSITISATGSGGTVTSVGGTGSVNGITLSGTVTSSGNLTLGGTLSGVSLATQVTGTLPYGNGGTGVTAAPTNGQLLIGNGSGYTLAAITAGSGITVTNGSGTITIAASGTSLTNWTEGVNTSSPNATVPVVSFTATNAATNVDASILPKGSGAFALAIADSTATGGNKRGTNAVDLQTSRANATEVASGSISFLAGSGSTASGSASVCIARSSSATNIDSAVVGGVSNTASGVASIVLGGSYGTTRSAVGLAHGGNPIANTAGASQFRKIVLGRQTTDATATVLTANTSAAAATNQVNLVNNSAFYFKGTVIANVTGGGNTKGWTIEGVIKRGASAATTALVGSATVTSNYADSGASTWAVSVTADTTNGCLAITVTGQASTTIRWVASIETTEVTF